MGRTGVHTGGVRMAAGLYTGQVGDAGGGRGTQSPAGCADAHDLVLAELSAVLFASFPRADQRRKGGEYLRGLLRAEGRKSIRNIARVIGGRATEQNLHHFISSSTWDWDPVRAALAGYLADTAPPQAWVVRPTVIPKAGQHSVGVGRRFVPSAGQMLNVQQAVGVWSASQEVSMPVNWRLHLSGAWLDDALRRSQAAIPQSVGPQTLGECAVETFLQVVSGWRLPLRPVVMDAREADGADVVRRLRRAGVPFVVRISSTAPLSLAAPALAGHGADEWRANQILGAVRDLRRPVMWTQGGRGDVLRTSLVAGVRVRVPGRVPGRSVRDGGELLLLGAGAPDHRWPQELWLTDLTEPSVAESFRLSRLTGRVDRDFDEIADQVGVRDFAGRSFDGWHRHVTLASAAHAVAALARARGRRPRGAVAG